MRGLLFQNFLADQRDQIGALQQLVDRPDAGVARFQHVAATYARHNPQTSGTDPFHSSDIGDEVFGDIDFEHSHGTFSPLRERCSHNHQRFRAAKNDGATNFACGKFSSVNHGTDRYGSLALSQNETIGHTSPLHATVGIVHRSGGRA